MVAAGAIVAGGAIAVSGSAAGLELGIRLAKGNGSRMGHNQHENKQIDDICKEFKLSKDQRRILHDYLQDYGGRCTYKQIKEIVNLLFGVK